MIPNLEKKTKFPCLFYLSCANFFVKIINGIKKVKLLFPNIKQAYYLHNLLIKMFNQNYNLLFLNKNSHRRNFQTDIRQWEWRKPFLRSWEILQRCIGQCPPLVRLILSGSDWTVWGLRLCLIRRHWSQLKVEELRTVKVHLRSRWMLERCFGRC